MSLKNKIQEEMKSAMKAGDKIKLTTLRTVLAQLKEVEIDKRRELTEEEEIQVLAKAAKKRKEAIEFYQKSDRTDLLEKEQQELEIINSFLPQPLTTDELEKIISDAIAETGATSLKEMGKVMSVVMPKVKGRAEGKIVQEMVRKKLS
ncbi:MAG: GatB/YqeY domain-containing protein [Calditrichaeota bacterium]|nr:MAG: GatB/YqeY domain-containing protein [Calditrichota bacterium]